ncbi:MAG: hypothetical protein ACE366_12225 [Bradymonadia bacterium]
MSASELPLPPGFESLTVEGQLRYLNRLWGHVVMYAGEVPVLESHLEVVSDRRKAALKEPAKLKAWSAVRSRLNDELSGG